MGFYRMNRGGSKPVAGQDALRLDVRWLRRNGHLRPLWRSSVEWSVVRFGERRKVGSIAVETTAGVDGRPDALTLLYAHGSGDKRQDVSERVQLEWMPVHLGGARPWFRCPRCGRRTAVLWGLRRFLCRNCNRVAYPVQNEGREARAERRAMKLRERLAFPTEPDFSVRNIDRKPKWMRRRTFAALKARALDAERDWHAVELRRWGAFAIDLLDMDPGALADGDVTPQRTRAAA